MLKGILNLFIGWRTVVIPLDSAADALNILQKYKFVYWQTERNTDGKLSFRMSVNDCKSYLNLCQSAGIYAEADRIHGVPALLGRYKRRWGIPSGILCAAVIIWLSTTVVWTIEITGNKTIPEEQIRRILQECGFREGIQFGNIDFDLFQNYVLTMTDEIAWLAINMHGTTAQVEVRENISADRGTHAGAANIIAAEDGQIVEVRLKSGRADVAIHDIVRKGDLLISGVMSIREDILFYDYAQGEVYAQVNRQIVAEVPLNQEIKVHSGEEYLQKTIIFFGKSIKFFQKGGIDTSTYDTIIENERLCFPGGIKLPVWVQTECHRAYRTETETISAEQAYELAQNRFRMAVGELLADMEILSLESTAVLENGVCRITGDAVCLRNIAETVEIPIS